MFVSIYKNLIALRILMIFLCIYLGEGRGGGYTMYGNIWSAFTKEPLNGCFETW